MKSIILALTLTLGFTNAYAHGDKKEALMCSKVGKDEFNKKMSEHQDHFLKKLKLTKAQEQQVKDIRAAQSDQVFAQVQKLRDAHSAFTRAVEKDAPKEEIRTTAKAMGTAKQEMMDAKIEEALSIREILTPEQRQKAIKEIQDKMNDMCD